MKLNKSTLFKNILRDQDDRGEILSIVDHNVSNVSIIKCNANTIRSNHYHLTDWHLMYVLSGKIDYFYKEIESDIINYLEVKNGDNIFTPPLEIHATYFPVETKLVVSSLNPRDQETYERDTVRVEFVNLNNIDELLKIHSK
tara:strand:+ start:609 stop:1034 length:426 start_codon:yes stop_codon:yes gene_type:complete